MSRLTRVRSLVVAAATEVNRIWRHARHRGGHGPIRGSARWFACDPLEARIMLVAPALSTVADQTTDEAKQISVNATFSDTDGPTGCSGYSATINWGDGTCSSSVPSCGCFGCISLSASGPCSCSSGPWCGTISALHIYADNRPSNQAYSATLTLSDGGSTATKTFAVTVRDVPPTLTMGGAATVAEEGSYTLTLARSDRGTDTLGSWNVNWGDGSTIQSVSSTNATTTVNHTFASGFGQPNIAVTASDEDGGPYSARKVSLDTGFGMVTGSLGRMQAVAVQADGKIVAAFGNGGFGIDKDFIVARYNANGTLDTASFGTVSGGAHLGYTVVDFGSSSSDYASSIALVTVGGVDKILVAGSRSSSSTSNDFAVLRFNASDGSLDTSFGTGGKVAIDFNGGYDFAYGMAIQGDKIVLAGSAAISASSNSYDFALARLNMDGSLDTGTTGDSDTSDGGFGRYVSGTSGPQTGKQTLDFISTSNSAYDVAIDPTTDKIVLGGTVQTTGSTGNDLAVARFTPDGMVDSTFGPVVSGTDHQGWAQVDVRSTNDNGRAVLIQADGRIVLGGSSEAATGDLTDFAMARWNVDGSLDDGGVNDMTPYDRFGTATSPPNAGTVLTNFAHGSDEAMRSILQVDGRLVAVGYSTGVYTGTDFAAVRYMPDGTLDPTFGDGGKISTDFGTATNDIGYAAALQADGKIVVGGIKGTSTGMIRYQPASTISVTVVPNAPTGLASGDVSDATVQLTWTDHSSVETGFVIQRSSDNGTTWTDTGTVGPNVTTYQAGGLTDATGYQFRVLAINGTYRSAASNTVSTSTNVKANPDYAEVGQLVHLRAPTGGSTSAVYTWNVYRGDQQFVSGTGGTFDFTPDAAGTYYVTTYTQDGTTTPVASTQTITVVDTVPQNVRISGPGVWPLDRTAVFNASAAASTTRAGSLHYQWSVQTFVTDPDAPSEWTPVSLPADVVTDLPTFRFTPDQNDNTQISGSVQYQITLVVSNDEGQNATATRIFKGVTTSQDFLNGAADFGGLGGSMQIAPTAIAVQPDDGKVVEVGYYSYYDSTEVRHVGFAVARFNPGGDQGSDSGDLTLDTTFGGGDGMVTTDFGTGTLPFGDNHSGAQALAIAPDGRIIVVGEVAVEDGLAHTQSAVGIVAYKPDGSLDSNFGPLQTGSTTQHTGIVIDDFGGAAGDSEGARAVAIQGDGKIVVSGWYHEHGDVDENLNESTDAGPFVKRVFIARYNADGTRDDGTSADSHSTDSFGPSGGRVVTTVSSYNWDNTSPAAQDGFDQPISNLASLTIQPGDGKIVAAGWANPTGQGGTGATWHDFLVMRLNPDGSFDSGSTGDSDVNDSFGTNGTGIITTDLGHVLPNNVPANRADFATTVLVQPDHRILVGGWTGLMEWDHVGGDDLAMVRYNEDGTLDDSFGLPLGTSHTGKMIDNPTGDYPSTTNPNDRIVGMVLQEDGKIVVTDTNSEEEDAHGRLARYMADGSRDDTFDRHTEGSSQVLGNYTDPIFFPGMTGIALGADGIYVAHKVDQVQDSFSLTRYMTRDASASSLTATARVSGAIDLRWRDGGGGEDGYGIERWDPGSQSFVDIGFVGNDVTNYTDTNVLPGTTYRYRVYGFVGDQVNGLPVMLRKGQSNEASATTAFPNDAHYKLQETIRVPVSGTHVQSKTDLLQGGSYILQASGYFELSSPTNYGGPMHADAEYGIFKPIPYDIRPSYTYTNIGVAVGDLGLTDHGDRGLYWGPLNDQGDHAYRMAYTGNGDKLDFWYRDDYYADNQTISDGNGGTKPYEMLVDVYRVLPQAPDHLTASPAPGTSPHITLSWRNNTPDAMSFQIERAADNGAFSVIGTVLGDQTIFIDSTGLATNTRYTYRVTAHTAADDSPASNLAVTVLLADHPVAFDAVQPQTIVTGKRFGYRVHATDPDEPWLKMTYSLGSGNPDLVTIDPVSGYIDWPSAGTPDTYMITVRASKDNVTFVSTSVQLTVTAAPLDGPTVSTPTATFNPATPNVVQLSASASENGISAGITYTWSVLIAPDDARFPIFSANNGTSDASSLTATFGPRSVTGEYVFLVTATDAAGNTDTGVAVVTVLPVVTVLRIKQRNAHVPQNVDYPFDAVVKDQFGHDIATPSLTWTLDGSTTPLSDADASVIVSTGTVAGSHTLKVEAASGVSDTVNFVNGGVDDQWPVIDKVLARPDPVDATKIWLTADATDDTTSAAGLTYQWTCVSRPTGAAMPTFDPSSASGRRISATIELPTSDIPWIYEFKVKVTDPAHASSPDDPPFTTVTFNTHRMLYSLILTPSAQNVAPGGSTPVTIVPTGKDQYGDAFAIDKTLINWGFYGAGSGSVDSGTHDYAWTPPTVDGSATITATLGSIVGAASLKAAAQAKPVVQIVSPTAQQRDPLFFGGIKITSSTALLDPATIDKDTDVYVSIVDPNDDPVSWTLTAVPAGDGTPIPLADDGGNHGPRGADTTAGEKIATIHPLLLPQGLYTLTLTADDGTTGPASVATQQFVVKTPLKLGNFTLPVTDLTVQGKGLPITVSRVYDSSRANKYDSTADAGDFGPGWRLEMPDTDMQVTATNNRPHNENSSSEYPGLFPGDVVYFTLPGGDVEGFQFTPQHTGEYHFPELYFTYDPQFTALNGSNSRLTVDWSHTGDLIQRELRLDITTGELFEPGSSGNVDYNPARSQFGGHYLLTTHDGTQYDIDAATGMVRTVTDSNGNTLKYNLGSDGKLASIDSYNNADDKTTVTIHRCSSDGRIDYVEDALNHCVSYAYGNSFTDPADSTITHPGELASVTDRAHNVTQYGYADHASDVLRYHLTSVTDPRGLPVLSATYDATTGELKSLSDPYKKTAGLGDTAFAGSDARKGVKDLAGNQTEMVYDSLGRLVRSVKEVKVNGVVSGYQMSVTAYGDGVVTDPVTGQDSVFLQSVTQYQPFTLPAAQKDQRFDFMPHIVASVTTYDPQGNVVGQTDAAGRTTTFSGYTTGATDDDPVSPTDSRPTLTGDAYGNETTFHYDAATGNLDHTTNDAGEETCYSYDTHGNVTQTSLDGGVSGTSDDVITSQTEYDGPDGQISVSKSDFRRSGSDWVPMSERDYDYTPATIGGVEYRRETVTLQWRDAVTDSDYTHALVESVTLYDADDRTWKVTDQNGRTTETLYNSLGKVAVTIDPFGGRTTYDYDARGNLIRTLSPDGTETRTAYDDLGRATWQTDRYASTSTAAGYIDNATAALATLSVYDDQGRVVQTMRYSGVLVRLDPDAGISPNTVGILTATAVGGMQVSTTGTQYDDAGRLKATTDAAGVTTLTTYYDDGRVKNTRQVVAGLPTNPGTTYAYDFTDSSNNLHRQDRVTDALGDMTTTDYDDLGQATKVTYDDTSFTETLYGVGGQPVDRSDVPLPDNPGTADDFPSTFEGQHVVKIAQRKADEPVVATHYLYDIQGRLTDVWQPKVHDAVSDADVWPHWHYAYDGMGNQASITDPKGHVTTFADTYDSSGHKLTHSRTLPAVSGSTVTETTTYDALGRTLAVTDFKGQTTAYRYDDSPAGQGRVFADYRFAAGVTAIDANKSVVAGNAAERTEYSYDALGRQSQIREYASGTGMTATRTTNYAYDPITSGVTLVDSPEGKVHHEYDPATGLLTRTWAGTSSASPTTDTLYGYDQLGRLKSVTSAKIDGSAPTAPHVQLNRVNAVGQTVSGNTLPTTTYDYDLAGNLDKVNLPNGDISDYDYDGLNRLTTLTTKNDGGFKLFEQDYTLESNGQRDYVIEKRFDGSSTSPFSTTKVDWTYDDLGRLTGETRDVGNDGQDGEDYVATYDYDLAGNRHEKVFNSANNTHDETVDYLYDNRDRLTSEDSDVTGNDVSYGYDGNGAMTSQTKGSTTTAYVWDLRNRLSGIDANNDDDVNDSVDTKYGYDEQGQRISEQPGNSGSTTRYFLNDKGNPSGYPQIIEEKLGTSGNSAAFDRSYVLGLSVIGQYDVTNGTLYLLKDGHGSTRALLNPNGAVGDIYDYQAFGEAISLDPTTAKTIDLFGGDAEFDPASNFYYHDKRWRQNFRFISMDDYAGRSNDPRTLHRYLYTPSDPINSHDFNGNDFALETVWAIDTGISLDTAGASVSRAYGRALGISTDIYDVAGTLADPYGPLATTLAWLQGFGEGAAQGVLNALNGVTDAFIGIVNLAIASSPAGNAAQALGIDLSIPAPDWSNGAIFNESAFEHNASKFLGGQGIITLATVGISAVISSAGQIHHVATVRSAEWTPLFEELFDEAGLSMEDAANKVRVAGHFGPHPELYHSYVYNYLLDHTAGATGTTLTVKLLNALEFLADECATPGTILNNLITK